MSNIFKIRREEKYIAMFIALCVVCMNMVMINYCSNYTAISATGYRYMMSYFRVSGFDAFTYYVVTDWHQQYIVFRHPLLAYMLFPAYLINSCIMSLCGFNAAIFIVALIEAFCGFYSVLFLYRILREVTELRQCHATILTMLYLSFEYVLLATAVPEHFGISAFLLILSLYISGKKLKTGRHWTRTESVLYFILTAGVTLTNGLKIFLSELFVNGKRFFQWKHLLLACIIPAGLLWGSALLTYDHFVKPMEAAERVHHAKVLKILKARQAHQPKGAKKEKGHAILGKPVSTVKFLNWTDITTPRGSSLVENFFGEPIQLHEDYLLADNWHTRPVIVRYHWWTSYFVEFIVVALCLAGIWYGRRSRFMWLVMSYFTIDLMLHIVMGFAINEVYIMSPHYLFAIPLCIAFLIKNLPEGKQRYASGITALLAAFLLVWNVTLMTEFFFIL